MEAQILISLKEYNEIKDIKNSFKKAFDEKKIIIHRGECRYYIGHSEYEYHIVNQDDVVSELRKEIIDLQNQRNNLKNEVWRLEDKLNTKKWWQKII